jgi:hypothetical protein
MMAMAWLAITAQQPQEGLLAEVRAAVAGPANEEEGDAPGAGYRSRWVPRHRWTKLGVRAGGALLGSRVTVGEATFAVRSRTT